MCADVAECVVAGECDQGLVEWAEGHAPGASVELGRDAASPGPVPARDLLPPLDRYAHLAIGGEHRMVGYVEASHGCAHRCRHCPVPVVYDGRIRLVGEDVVVADVAELAGRGARHITFGAPDFANGPHPPRRVGRPIHDSFPTLTLSAATK